jgi:gluconolactonase
MASFLKDLCLAALAAWATTGACGSGTEMPVPKRVASGFKFTEGPAAGPCGAVFFSDVPNSRIHRYDPKTGQVTTHLENTGGVNGIDFDREGRLVGCASRSRQLVRFDSAGVVTVLAATYAEKKLNSPNDLWIDGSGGIYFTDPRYGKKENLEQDGMHVYYLPASGAEPRRVIADLTRPNGIIGTPDGKMLYVVDEGARKTFAYPITGPGLVGPARLLCEEGIDGLTLTSQGTVCLAAEKSVAAYAPNGRLLHRFTFEAHPTNVLFHEGSLWVTTQAGELFKIAPVQGW